MYKRPKYKNLHKLLPLVKALEETDGDSQEFVFGYLAGVGGWCFKDKPGRVRWE